MGKKKSVKSETVSTSIIWILHQHQSSINVIQVRYNVIKCSKMCRCFVEKRTLRDVVVISNL